MILHRPSVRVGLAWRDQLVRRSASRTGSGLFAVHPVLVEIPACRYNTKRDVRGHVWCDGFCGVYNGRECQFGWWEDHKRDRLSRACRSVVDRANRSSAVRSYRGRRAMVTRSCPRPPPKPQKSPGHQREHGTKDDR
jgi:hypothetical protein